MANGKLWTQDEITFLKDTYPKCPPQIIAEKLDRSIQSVTHKASRMKIRTGCFWSPKELAYLENSWGKVSIKTICKHLGRNQPGVEKMVCKLGLGAFLNAGEYIALFELMRVVGRGFECQEKRQRWISDFGLPAKRKKVRNSYCMVVYVKDFWEWAEKNRSFINFIKMERNILGKEPPWAQEQRKVGMQKAKELKELYPNHCATWTLSEDNKLIRYMKKYQYTLAELSQKMGRTGGAILSRIRELGIKESPITMEIRKWTQDEEEQFLQMIKSGMRYGQMEKQSGRSFTSLQQKALKTYRTSNLDKIICIVGGGKTESGGT